MVNRSRGIFGIGQAVKDNFSNLILQSSGQEHFCRCKFCYGQTVKSLFAVWSSGQAVTTVHMGVPTPCYNKLRRQWKALTRNTVKWQAQNFCYSKIRGQRHIPFILYVEEKVFDGQLVSHHVDTPAEKFIMLHTVASSTPQLFSHCVEERREKLGSGAWERG